MSVTLLAIESSCDDTSAAIIQDGYVLSNLIANQDVHRYYGGVVPELASRAHQVNIVPVADQAIVRAGIQTDDISAVAFTRGPGLLGSLLVGTSFAKGFALARKIPLIEVNHLQAHVLAHFVLNKGREDSLPGLPFLCLLVSGGHTRIIVVHKQFEMEVIGNTIDDAAGEAFDKCGKLMGLPYPAGPLIDKLASTGNINAFRFTRPKVDGLDFSFSGLKTNFLYFLNDKLKENSDFLKDHLADLCASLQKTIIDILMTNLIRASVQQDIREIGIAGGVSANSALREALKSEGEKRGWRIFIPPVEFTTDNAAMIGIAGYYKYLRGEFAGQDVAPLARY